MGKLISLYTDYQQFNPEQYLISERLNQLIDVYGREEVECELTASDSHSEINIHINNLMLSYGRLTVIIVSNIIFKQKRKSA